MSDGAVDIDLNQMEDVILTKVQQRTPPRMNEDTFLVKVFRHHDLGNTGFCEFDKFKKALTPFVSGISNMDLERIFQRYAPDGALNYKAFAAEFVSGVRRVPGLVPDTPGLVMDTIEDTLNKIKDYIYCGGPRGIIAVVSAFRDADPMNQRVLTYGQFLEVMTEFFGPTDCEVTEEQLDQIFQTFKQMYAPDQIAYDELLLALKEEPSAERRASIRAAFRRLDTNSEGLVDIMSMINNFNANRHPQVSDGTRDANEVLEEFAETLKDLVLFRRGARSYPTNLVAWEEFEDYYKFISGCYETDGFFCSTMQKVWDLDKVPDMAIEARASMAAPAAGIPAKSRAGLHHWQTNTLPTSPTYRSVHLKINLDQVLERARAQVGGQGIRAAVNVVKNFYMADDDNDDLLDVYEFRRACQQSALHFSGNEEAAIFKAHGEGPGKMSAVAFLNALQGPMPASRVALVERVWLSLGGDLGDENSAVTPAVLKDRIACDRHPKVMKGETVPEVILGEFLDTFSLLAYVRGGCQNSMVTFADLLAYYEVVSSTIENDTFFELLLNRLWLSPSEAWGESALNFKAASQSGKMLPAFDQAKKSPMAEPRPPIHEGPSAYATFSDRGPENGESHRRFLRKEPQALPTTGPLNAAIGMEDLPPPALNAQYSAITKSSIVFDEEGSSEVEAVCKRLRSALRRRGLKGWRQLNDRFSSYDNRKNGGIMRTDWERMHKTLGLGLSPEERELLFRALSANRKDGAMCYNSCLRHLKNTLPPRRQNNVGNLYEYLKDPRTGTVPNSVLKARFDVRNTPQCILGSQDVATCHREFQEAVDYFGPEGDYSPEEFMDLFAMVSALHEEEHEFSLMTTAAFGMPLGSEQR
mmetsp:Transcript_4461/g.8077  ORF Transcript_4461/g.8077 Transcript_4461/m.8077 type:complete len:867 (+) Transcript_4461:96-2696(+)